MRYLLKRTYSKNILEYKDLLSEFEVEYVNITDYCDEEYTIAILTLNNLDELNKFSSIFIRLVIDTITWQADDFKDYKLDKDIIKLIEIYDDYRE